MVANGAGGTYSTAGDMLRFAAALRAGTLIPFAEFEALCAPRNEREPGAYYGLGCVTRGEGPARGIGHGGGALGMQTWFLIFPESDLDLVVMSNQHLQAEPIVQTVTESLQQPSR